MKAINSIITGFGMFIFILAGCNQPDHQQEETGHQEETQNEVHLTTNQVEALGLKMDTIPVRNLSDVVDANGELEVPPQNEASVTPVIGANVSSIEVIEGDKVKKGQVLAWLDHPDIIKLQADYANHWNQLQYLEQEYKRQKRLYEEEVGSGKAFQQTQADYHSSKSRVNSLEAQLKLLGIRLNKVRQGDIFEKVSLRSPIEGYIKKVKVKTGQFVKPSYEMFQVVNNHHIHADLMVFEKDVHKVKTGQKIRFSVATLPEKELTARIYSVGKSFEQDPKAVHIHAEIENKQGLLIPGMYIKGQILVSDFKTKAMPESAVVREGEGYFIFAANQQGNEWHFQPIRVIPGIKNNGWVEVKPYEAVEPGSRFVMNNAYYLLAEMKKGEGGGHHH